MTPTLVSIMLSPFTFPAARERDESGLCETPRRKNSEVKRNYPPLMKNPARVNQPPHLTVLLCTNKEEAGIVLDLLLPYVQNPGKATRSAHGSKIKRK